MLTTDKSRNLVSVTFGDILDYFGMSYDSRNDFIDFWNGLNPTERNEVLSTVADSL